MFQKGSLDTEKRLALKKELTDTMRRLKKAGEGFEVLIAPGEEGIWALVIEDIMRANPDFSLVAWPSGPAIVRRKDVDAINGDFKKVNESTGFITHGGADFDIESVDPRPMGVGGPATPAELERVTPNTKKE